MKDLLHVDIYTKDGEFVRGTQIREEGIYIARKMALTTGGRTALVQYRLC